MAPRVLLGRGPAPTIASVVACLLLATLSCVPFASAASCQFSGSVADLAAGSWQVLGGTCTGVKTGEFLGPLSPTVPMVSNPVGEYLKFKLFDALNYAAWQASNPATCVNAADCDTQVSSDWTMPSTASRYTADGDYTLVVYCDNGFNDCDFDYAFDLSFFGKTHTAQSCGGVDGASYYDNVIPGKQSDCSYPLPVDYHDDTGYQCWDFHDCGYGVCGDDDCNASGSGETCGNCESDCFATCTCGDGLCSSTYANETCASCEADCYALCSCGDGWCSSNQGNETCANCESDCYADLCTCGDGLCSSNQGNETCAGCETDCFGLCTCGDGLCSSGAGNETCAGCEVDCFESCTCGDSVCSNGAGNETCVDCEADCYGLCTCGDFVCSDAEAGESCATCSDDCWSCFDDCRFSGHYQSLGQFDGVLLGACFGVKAGDFLVPGSASAAIPMVSNPNGAALSFTLLDFVNETAWFDYISGGTTYCENADCNVVYSSSNWTMAATYSRYIAAGNYSLWMSCEDAAGCEDISFDIDLRSETGTTSEPQACPAGSVSYHSNVVDGKLNDCVNATLMLDASTSDDTSGYLCYGFAGCAHGVCGDGDCNAAGSGESCETCPGDCGVCACGDGRCSFGAGFNETCISCPEDCGVCECGNSECAEDEADWCIDCGCSGAVCCGDSVCQAGAGESCEHCPLDCGACCVPDCADKECGDDGCGGDCGSCDTDNGWKCQEATESGGSGGVCVERAEKGSEKNSASVAGASWMLVALSSGGILVLLLATAP